MKWSNPARKCEITLQQFQVNVLALSGEAYITCADDVRMTQLQLLTYLTSKQAYSHKVSNSVKWG